MENIKDGAYRIYISSAAGMDFTGSTANSVEEAKEMVKKWKPLNEYAEYVVVTPDHKHVSIPHSIWDSADVDNAHSKWTTDDNEPLKQKVEATLERTGLRSAVNAIYGKYPSKIGLDIDPSKSTEIVSVLKKDFSKVIYNSDTFEVVIGDALGFTSVEVPKKIAEELMLGWDIDRVCKDFHLNVTKKSSSYYFVGESSWIDKFYKAYGLDQFGIRIKDSAPVADSKIEYVFNWRDTYHKTQQKTAVLANNIGEAIRKFADYVALAGVGTANAYVISISPNDGWVALYGTAHELKKKMGDSMPVADKLVEIPQAILNRIESIAASRGYKVAAKGETLFGRKHYEFTPLNPVTDSQMRAFVDEVDSYARSKNVPATFSANVTKVVFDFDKIYVKDSAVSKEAAVKEFLEMNPAYKNKGIIEARDAATVYAPIVDEKEPKYKKGDKVKYEGKTYYVAGVRGERDGVTFYHLTESKELDGVGRFNAAETKITHADAKMFKVVDKATGKTLLVKATDSLAAVKRVSSLKDTAYTVTARTNDFPYGNNVAVIVDANSEDEAVAKCRRVFEARGDKINHISATPTTSSDIAKGISRFKN